MTKTIDKDKLNATEARRQREHKLLERVGYRKVKVSEEQEREDYVRRLEERNALLQKRVDVLLQENEGLIIDLQKKVQSSVDEARRKSWGGNGRY
jgi:signal transduction protein with GAF and PtsI domain